MSSPEPVLCLGPFMPGVEERLSRRFAVLPATPETLDGLIAEHGAAIRAMTTRGHGPTDATLMDRLPRLELIATFAVGYDTIDVAAAKARGIVVANTPDVLTDEVADLTVGLTLATIRELPQADRFLRAGAWPKGAYPLTASLRDRSIGIVGMGRIGQAIAARLKPFGRPIAYHARRKVEGLGYEHFPDLTALAAAVDVLIVILPGGPATRGVIDGGVLEALGPRGVLINVARGSVVDEPALIAALKTGTIAAAGLDVFAQEPNIPAELIEMGNVVLLPHVGSGTHVTRAAMADLAMRNVESWFDGAGPITPVPETPWPRD
jgi:lactate dehydrogenase-like 2-hydroxyacid dehydrogenase